MRRLAIFSAISRDALTILPISSNSFHTANSRELTDMAVAIFVGLLEVPNVATGGGGGGSQSDLPWRDKDEDDLQWARRCARAASRLLGKKPKTGLKR